MEILIVERGLIELKIVAIYLSNPIVSLEIVAFRFKVFNKQMNQKSKHNFNKSIRGKLLLISLTVFPIK